MRPVEGRWFAEYEAVRAFGWTHDEYMDTPREAADWLLRIHREVKSYEAERQKEADKG